MRRPVVIGRDMLGNWYWAYVQSHQRAALTVAWFAGVAHVIR